MDLIEVGQRALMTEDYPGVIAWSGSTRYPHPFHSISRLSLGFKNQDHNHDSTRPQNWNLKLKVDKLHQGLEVGDNQNRHEDGCQETPHP